MILANPPVLESVAERRKPTLRLGLCYLVLYYVPLLHEESVLHMKDVDAAGKTMTIASTFIRTQRFPSARRSSGDASKRGAVRHAGELLEGHMDRLEVGPSNIMEVFELWERSHAVLDRSREALKRLAR